MGKASRRKHEQRLAKQLQQASPEQLPQTCSRQPTVAERGTTIIFQPQTFIVEAPSNFVGPVYRFFSTAEDAERMISGQIPISTIDHIRRLENGLATDAEELNYVSYVNDVDVQSGTVTAAIAKQFGFVAEAAGSFGMRGIKMVANYPDAFLLCTTTDFEAMRVDGRFGKFCVEINDPEAFFNAVTEHLKLAAGVTSGTGMPVTYGTRESFNFAGTHAETGFAKPHRFSPEAEFRFLWTAADSKQVVRRFWDIPPCVPFCRRLL